MAHLCRRPFKPEDICAKAKDLQGRLNRNSVAEPPRKVHELPNIPIYPQQPQSLLNSGSIENYMSSVRSLTFGYSHMNGLLPSNDAVSSEIDGSSTKKLKQMMEKIDYRISYKVCAFACKYSTFLHFGIVDRLFMEDHNRFWRNVPDGIDYQSSSLWVVEQAIEKKEKNSRDFQFWMSLYLSMLCVGFSFGIDTFENKVPFDRVELQELPKILFRESLTWIERTDFLERPEIRTIQVYCLMTTCLHALGNIFIHRELLAMVIVVSQVLRLDRIEPLEDDSGIEFSREIMKRLWYSFFIIDSISNVPRRLIGKFTTPYPALVSTDDLLRIAPSARPRYYYGYVPGVQTEIPTAEDDIAGLTYQRLMSQLAEHKQKSYEEPVTLDKLMNSWKTMQKMRHDLETYFDRDPYSIDDHRIKQFAKYLLFSSITREILGLGARILTLTGREFWMANFRAECLDLALEVVDHNSMRNVPSYYKRYWIVGQHLIYACLFVLLDMLMFKHEKCEENLMRIEQAIPTVRLLRETHATVRIGLAVIEKLYYLVSAVRLGHVGSGSVEGVSLRKFLKELQVANPHYPSNSPEGKRINQKRSLVPHLGQSQYLRKGLENEILQKAAQPNPLMLQNGEMSRPASFLDPDLGDVLDETGWKEFLDFFFGNQTNTSQ